MDVILGGIIFVFAIVGLVSFVLFIKGENAYVVQKEN